MGRSSSRAARRRELHHDQSYDSTCYLRTGFQRRCHCRSSSRPIHGRCECSGNCQSLVNAIRGSTLGLLPRPTLKRTVCVGGDANTVLNVSNTQLRQAGTPGVDAARANQDLGCLPASIKWPSPIRSHRSLTVRTSLRVSDRVRRPRCVSGALSVSVTSRTDSEHHGLCRQRPQANQANGQTTLTVLLGEGLDYGDAPESELRHQTR